MRIAALLWLLATPACVGAGLAEQPIPEMVVLYHDLPLATPAGRAALVRRVEQAAADFCRSYDAGDPRQIFDVRLASARNCPGTARTMLLQRMPGRVRRAYRAAQRGWVASHFDGSESPHVQLRPFPNNESTKRDSAAMAPASFSTREQSESECTS